MDIRRFFKRQRVSDEGLPSCPAEDSNVTCDSVAPLDQSDADFHQRTVAEVVDSMEETPSSVSSRDVHYVAIVEALEELASVESTSNAATRQRAHILYCATTSSSFIVCLHIVAKYSARLEPVTNVLQSVSMDFHSVHDHITELQNIFCGHRTNAEEQFSDIMKTAIGDVVSELSQTPESHVVRANVPGSKQVRCSVTLQVSRNAQDVRTHLESRVRELEEIKRTRDDYDLLKQWHNVSVTLTLGFRGSLDAILELCHRGKDGFVGRVRRSLNLAVYVSEVWEGNAFHSPLPLRHFSKQSLASLVGGVTGVVFVTRTRIEASMFEAMLHSRCFSLAPRVFEQELAEVKAQLMEARHAAAKVHPELATSHSPLAQMQSPASLPTKATPDAVSPAANGPSASPVEKDDKPHTTAGQVDTKVAMPDRQNRAAHGIQRKQRKTVKQQLLPHPLKKPSTPTSTDAFFETHQKDHFLRGTVTNEKSRPLE
ncbi:hypothetical protein HPB50_004960 [Hyalomma asiaticum]|uniref:Uncharacterized protein n=1 Tax=Hyalomma asiaticum TaxID=266040 RepID=A0ACB7RVD0_HYAAI|nr:hypothetical protein HPB50_004960 [Hyalomma asiaticum]